MISALKQLLRVSGKKMVEKKKRKFDKERVSYYLPEAYGSQVTKDKISGILAIFKCLSGARKVLL